MEIRAVRDEEELERVFHLWAAAFADTPRDFFVRSVREDPAWEPWQTRVAVEGNRVISAVQIFHREVSFARRWVVCGGIGNVGTDPSWRGRGAASALMQDALDQMRRRGYGISILFTGIHGFYRRFGYRSLPMRRLRFEKRVRGSGARLGVREAGEGDWPEIQRVHEAYASTHPLLVRRDEARWHSLDRGAISTRPVWLVYEGDGFVRGYLRVDEIDRSWRITEFGCGDLDARQVDALLEVAFEWAGTDRLLADALDREGVLTRSSHYAGDQWIDELMLAVVDESRLAELTGLGVEDLRAYLRWLESEGVDFWRTDFF